MKEKCSFKNLSILWMKIFLISILFLGENQLVYSQFTTLSKATQQCLNCHKTANPGLVAQWEKSIHYKMEVGCYECHQATEGEIDAFIHSEPETYISTIVSPKDCSKCHPKEVIEFSKSVHSNAHELVADSLGIFIGKCLLGNNDLKTTAYPEGASAADVNGCWKCHGSAVKLTKKDNQVKLDPATWPNTGMGRINPDSSKGSCSACHSTHQFSIAQARQPESCGVCHSGDASLFEYGIYTQSKHGANYAIFKSKMNLDGDNWVAGVDYYSATTCASCHMTAAPGIDATHNVSARVDSNSQNMTQVCSACHSGTFIDNYYLQVEAEKSLVNNKWIDPAGELYCLATALLKEISQDNEKVTGKYYLLTNPIDYTYLSLGKNASVARLAASMMSPQYVEDNNKALAENWFGTFVPQLQKLICQGMSSPKTKALAKKLDERLKYWLSQPMYGNSKWPKVTLKKCP